jgi:hypothetical protein
MGSANHATDSVNTNVPMMNAFLHPFTGEEMQYKDLMKDSTLGPLYKKDSAVNLDAYARGSETFKVQTPASLLSSLTFLRTAKSHMVSLNVTINRIRQKKNGSC